MNSEKKETGQELVSVHYFQGDNDDTYAVLIMDHKTFFEIWKIIDGWDINCLVTEDDKPITKEYLASIRANSRIPLIFRNEDTEELFKRFNILTDKFTGAVRAEPDTQA
jgi:hypothetical protein